MLEFFDCNVRLGRVSAPPPVSLPYNCEELAAELDRGGIVAALVYHSWAKEWDPAQGNQRLLKEIDGWAQFYPCFVTLPPATGETMPPAELAALAVHKHGAVRVYPGKHEFRLIPWNCGELLEALADASVPLLVERTETTWDDLAAVLSTYPALPVILLETSYRIGRRLYALWEQHPNLYLEANTYKAFWGIEDICAQYGAERLVFGTHLPINETGPAVAQLTYSPLADRQKALISGGNMRRLLGLEGS